MNIALSFSLTFSPPLFFRFFLSSFCLFLFSLSFLLAILLSFQMLIPVHSIFNCFRNSDHFRNIAERGGELEEIDPMTTTAGVLDLFTKNEYVK